MEVLILFTVNTGEMKVLGRVLRRAKSSSPHSNFTRGRADRGPMAPRPVGVSLTISAHPLALSQGPLRQEKEASLEFIGAFIKCHFKGPER